MGEKKYRFSIRKKMVLGICAVAAVTYATTAVFIFYLSGVLEGLLGLSENVFIILTLILGVIWCGILGFFGAGVITRPLNELEASAVRVAAGDINENVNVPRSDDEIRALAKAYNEMIDNLRYMVRDINDNFSKTNEKALAIREASGSAADQSENISRTVEEISSGAEHSANVMQKTAESMGDVTQIASNVAVNARSANELSKEMVSVLDSSKQIIQSLVTGIQRLVEENEKSLLAVERLENHANKVGEIISLVGDISSQTNLLALNASIEAARAGEHGRGFAVVADEVRKLADESAGAVQAISRLVNDIQEEVSHVSGQITNQVNAAKKEAEKGADTDGAISQVSHSVNEAAASVEEILQLVEKQMVRIEETSGETQDVAAIAEQTSAGALEVSSSVQQQTAVMQEITASVDMLLKQADSLKKTINKFAV